MNNHAPRCARVMANSAKTMLWTPLLNPMKISVGGCASTLCLNVTHQRNMPGCLHSEFACIFYNAVDSLFANSPVKKRASNNIPVEHTDCDYSVYYSSDDEKHLGKGNCPDCPKFNPQRGKCAFNRQIGSKIKCETRTTEADGENFFRICPCFSKVRAPRQGIWRSMCVDNTS